MIVLFFFQVQFEYNIWALVFVRSNYVTQILNFEKIAWPNSPLNRFLFFGIIIIINIIIFNDFKMIV